MPEQHPNLTSEQRRDFKSELLTVRHKEDARAVVCLRMEEVEADSKGVVRGVAAVYREFNSHNDFNLPGCFDAALERRGVAGIKPNFYHDWRQGAGHLLSAGTEDNLLLETQIVGHNDRDVYYREWVMIREGVLNGLSIEFNPISSRTRWMRGDEYELEDLGTPDDFWLPPREMVELDWMGYGFVLHPSADQARVQEARSITRFLNTPRFAVQWGERRGVAGRGAPKAPQEDAAQAAQAHATNHHTTNNDSKVNDSGLRGLLDDLKTQRAKREAARIDQDLRSVLAQLKGA